MRKIPTIFSRDWDGDRSKVIDVPHPDCGWVFAGEGVATRKLDGTSCLVREGKLYKRREIKHGQTTPPGFELATHDEETGKTVGWVPVGDASDDRWHREAFASGTFADGTYELLGPHVQGNPEKLTGKRLFRTPQPRFMSMRRGPSMLYATGFQVTTSKAWSGTTRMGGWPRSSCAISA